MSNTETPINAEPDEHFLLQTWNDFCNQSSSKSITKTYYDSNNKKEDFIFYFLEAYENYKLHPGLIFLFGKTYSSEENNYRSCCVVVENVEKLIYLQPREFKVDSFENSTDEVVKISDVENEFCAYAKKKGITSIKVQQVTKKSFLPNTPEVGEYLQVKFYGNLCYENVVFRTILQVFGLSTSRLETFLLSHEIKGPCWLKTNGNNESGSKYSRCKVEISTKDVTNLYLKEIPPLVVLYLDFKFNLANLNEFASISCLIDHNYSFDKNIMGATEGFTIISRLTSNVIKFYLPNIKLHIVNDEKELLNTFFSLINQYDPDLIIGNDLINRCFTLMTKKVDSKNCHLSKLVTSYQREFGTISMVGRLVCDLQISVKEVLRLKNYDFYELCKVILKIPAGNHYNLESDVLEENKDLKRFILSSILETTYMLKIIMKLNIIKFAFEITKIAGNLLSKTLTGTFIDRLEYFFLHTFNEENYLLPNKPQFAIETKSFTGGLILEPKLGRYSTYILLMDFASLYPSIMLEYNICLTNSKDQLRILPLQIKKLIDKRRKLKNIDRTLELALKFMANSIYGYLSYKRSRFYAVHLSALIAEKGREILNKSVYLLSDYSVIYGDTDSIMIDTGLENYDDVIKIGETIKGIINQTYKYIEIETEAIYKKLLLIDKRKYAGLKLLSDKTEVIELKGVEIVKRDYCAITSEISEMILNEIFYSKDSDRDSKIICKLQELKDKIHTYPPTSFILHNKLGKNLIEYNCDQPPPFLQVALRNNTRAGRKFKSGDIVSYLICLKDNKTYPCLLEECRLERYKIDYNFYIQNQIKNPVKSICQYVSASLERKVEDILSTGTIIAKYNKKQSMEPFLLKQNVNSYQPFNFKCRACNGINVIAKINLLLQCTRCSVHLHNHIASIKNQLIVTIRGLVKKLAQIEFQCLSCKYVCKKYLFNSLNLQTCPRCLKSCMTKSYSSKDLLLQLMKFQDNFDTTGLEEGFRTPEVVRCVNLLRKYVDDQIMIFGLDVIDLGRFSYFMPSGNFLNSC